MAKIKLTPVGSFDAKTQEVSGEISLTDVTGKDGKASGVLHFVGKTKIVNIDYEIEDKNVVAGFKINLQDYGFSKISYVGRST